MSEITKERVMALNGHCAAAFVLKSSCMEMMSDIRKLQADAILYREIKYAIVVPV